MFQAAAAAQKDAKNSKKGSIGDYFSNGSAKKQDSSNKPVNDNTKRMSRPSLQPRSQSDINRKINSTDGFEQKSSILSLDDLSDDESMEATLKESDNWGSTVPSKRDHSMNIKPGIPYDRFADKARKKHSGAKKTVETKKDAVVDVDNDDDDDDDDIFEPKPVSTVKKSSAQSVKPTPIKDSTPNNYNSSRRSTERKWDFDELVRNKCKPRALPIDPKADAGSKHLVSLIDDKDKKLSQEQEAVLSMVMNGTSLFYTGAAGTGKSFLLHTIIDRLRNKYGDKAVAVCAPTGLAALNVKGETIFKWAGIGQGREAREQLTQKVKNNKKNKEKWLECRVLVIDEVSMLSAELFDKLYYIAQTLRQDQSAFGGIQLVLTGDFYQLPPVTPDSNVEKAYAFNAQNWNKSIQKMVIMEQVFRQKDDIEFISLLNQLRTNKITDAGEAKYKALARDIPYNDGMEPTQLFSTNREVISANSKRMRGLKGREFVYDADDFDKSYKNESIYKSMIAPEKVSLKANAQVMLVKNQEDGQLVNGSQGIVKTFCPHHLEGPFLEFWNHSDEKLEVFNKLINAQFDETKVDAPTKQVFDQSEFLKKAQNEFYKMVSSINNMYEWYPLVSFKDLEGGDNTMKLITRGATTEKDPRTKKIIAERKQVHLIPSWALSIHKSQGQTLDRVKVDISSAFEKGQVYVAISRARSLDTLQVIGFNRSKVRIASAVVDFYSKLAPCLEK